MWGLADDVDDGEAGLGQSEIVFGFAGFEIAAGVAAIFVVVQIGIACSHFGFEAPAAVEHELVAQSDTCADEPAFVAVLFEGVEDAAGEFHVRNVEAAGVGVDAEEEAVEAFARPVAPFGLDGNVLELFVGGFVEVEGIESHLHVKGLLLVQAELEAEVGRGGRVVEQIVLDHDLLCACPDEGGCHEGE